MTPNDPKLSDCGGESASRSSSLERMVRRRWGDSDMARLRKKGMLYRREGDKSEVHC